MERSYDRKYVCVRRLEARRKGIGSIDRVSDYSGKLRHGPQFVHFKSERVVYILELYTRKTLKKLVLDMKRQHFFLCPQLFYQPFNISLLCLAFFRYLKAKALRYDKNALGHWV